MNKKTRLVIIGSGDFAEIAYEYFTYDSDFEVVGFAVEKQYRNKDILFNKPIIDLENIKELYPPDQYVLFTAITITRFNTAREKIYNICKEMGYGFASYVSSKSFVWRNAEIGENTFIFENCTIQYNSKVGNSVIMWSGTCLSHRSTIGNYCFIAPNTVISAYVKIGQGTFIGGNSTIGDEVTICNNTFIGAGSVIIKSIVEEGKMYVGNPAKLMGKTAYEYFNIEIG